MANSKIVATVATEILKNNDFSNVLNALAANNLSLLRNGDNIVCLSDEQKVELFSILRDMCVSNVMDVAVDMFLNNSFISIVNALAHKCLDSLHIKDDNNANLYAIFNDDEKEKLSLALDSMCNKKSIYY